MGALDGPHARTYLIASYAPDHNFFFGVKDVIHCLEKRVLLPLTLVNIASFVSCTS